MLHNMAPLKKRKLFSKHNRLPNDPTLGDLRSPFCSVTEHFSLQELRVPSLTRIIYLQDELAESVNEMSSNSATQASWCVDSTPSLTNVLLSVKAVLNTSLPDRQIRASAPSRNVNKHSTSRKKGRKKLRIAVVGVNASAHNNFEFMHLLTRNTSREKVSAYLSAAHSLPQGAPCV